MTLALDQLLALRDALADALSEEWERLSTYLFRRRRKDVTLWDEDDLDELLDDYDWGPLAQTLQQPAVIQSLSQAFTAGSGEAEVQLGIAWGAKNAYALAYAQQRAAEMVGMRRRSDGTLVPNPSAQWRITDHTRAELKRLILDTMDGASSYRDLKEQIEALPAFGGLFGEHRAEAIARSELALATNAGTFDTYAQLGIEYVRVHDGAGCGWTRHDDPDKADGSVRTLDDAREHPISHPNCVRAFSSWRPEKAMASFAKEGDGGGGEAGGITVDGTGLIGHRLEGQRPRCDDDCPVCEGGTGVCICAPDAHCRGKEKD